MVQGMSLYGGRVGLGGMKWEGQPVSKAARQGQQQGQPDEAEQTGYGQPWLHSSNLEGSLSPQLCLPLRAKRGSEAAQPQRVGKNKD